ncbi:hypothetical protein BS78_03G178400 [Paspalum vaginatum]|nr:hypothetical protein BS78_03G178400 [Paspalum vaginatum]
MGLPPSPGFIDPQFPTAPRTKTTNVRAQEHARRRQRQLTSSRSPAMTSRQAPEAAGADNAEPAHEWLDDGGANYLLRLDLPGFKKEDLSVYVNGEGLLTVVAQRKPTPSGTGGSEGKALRLRKSFQLPSTANLDAITGRFDGTILTLTVPKLQQEQPAGPAGAAAAAPPPPSAPPQAKEEPRRVAGDDKHAADQEDDRAGKVGREPAARASLTERSREGDEKAKPVAPPPPPLQPSESAAKGQRREDQDGKARDDHHREEVAREAARRIEAARARVAEAKAKAERERKCEHWKDRAMEEGLKLADTLSRNKEAIATAVAAFTLGVFVSSRLFSRN